MILSNMISNPQAYTKALQYTRAFLSIEPGNQQVANLETLVKKKMEAGT